MTFIRLPSATRVSTFSGVKKPKMYNLFCSQESSKSYILFWSYHSFCIVLYCIVLYCIVLYRIASHRIASHRITSHRIALHCIASHRIASHHSHRIASHQKSPSASLHPRTSPGLEQYHNRVYLLFVLDLTSPDYIVIQFQFLYFQR